MTEVGPMLWAMLHISLSAAPIQNEQAKHRIKTLSFCHGADAFLLKVQRAVVTDPLGMKGRHSFCIWRDASDALRIVQISSDMSHGL